VDKIILALLLVLGIAPAQAECIIRQKSVSKDTAVITERSSIKRTVVPDAAHGKKCAVDFSVRIGQNWYRAFGEYVWDGDRPSGEACAAAVAQAEKDVLAQTGNRSVMSEDILICTDDPDHDKLPNTNPGTIARLDQYRLHPDYPNDFYYNGTRCRFFLEPMYQNRNVLNYTGVICQLHGDKWAVVDKF
jgi:hypothetical protein